MIGREATKNPGIFFEIKTLFETGKKPEAIPKQKQMSDLIDIYKEFNLNIKLNELKEHIKRFSSGLDNSNSFKEKIDQTKNLEEIKKEISKLK